VLIVTEEFAVDLEGCFVPWESGPSFICDPITDAFQFKIR